jgi:hypothetical protein
MGWAIKARGELLTLNCKKEDRENRRNCTLVQHENAGGRVPFCCHLPYIGRTQKKLVWEKYSHATRIY